jgi:phosphoglycerate dehydrogenase-like enzyme
MAEILIAMPDAQRFAELIEPPSGVRIVPLDRPDDAHRHPSADALVLHPLWASQNLIDALPSLRWIQFSSSGTDVLAHLNFRKPVLISSSAGMHVPQMSELIFFYMLNHLRDIHLILARQTAHQWQPGPQKLLAGKRILIVGVGAIAEGLADRCQAFGMKCDGVSRRTAVAGFDKIWNYDQLGDAVAQADFVVALTPHGPSTHHLINSKILRRMQASAMLINVARGPVVDTEALVEALRQQRIAAAGLDVFEQEPLPGESPLWDMNNALLTPHIGGMSENYLEQLAPVVQTNIDRWNSGAVGELLNIVRQPV